MSLKRLESLLRLATLITAMLLSGGWTIAAAKPASQAQDVAMTFTLVRDSRAACGSACAQWISAQGRIDVGAAARFNAFLRSIGDVQRPVLLHSPGGSVLDAMIMGRAIRARGLTVVVAKTMFEPCASPCKAPERRGEPVSAGAYCASACPLVFAAGQARIVSPLAYLGLHQIRATYQRYNVTRRFLVRYKIENGKKQEISRRLIEEVRKPVASITRIATPGMDHDVEAYLTSMGVEAAPLIKIIVSTPASAMHWLTYEELSASHLSTSRLSGERMKLLSTGASVVFDGSNAALFP